MRRIAGLAALILSSCSYFPPLHTPLAPNPLVIAHRANGFHLPENSIEEIDECIKYGIRKMEIDIRYTSDHVPILMHDPSLRRTTGKHKRVNEYSSEEIVSIQLKNSDARIPSLEEVLSSHYDAEFFLHIKDEPLGPAVEMVNKYHAFNTTYFVIRSTQYDEARELLKKYPLRIVPCFKRKSSLRDAENIPYFMAMVGMHPEPGLISELEKRGKIPIVNIFFFQKALLAHYRNHGIAIQTNNPRFAIQKVIQQYATQESAGGQR